MDSPPGEQVPIFPPVDAVTDERLAYMRFHGRNTEGYMRGRSVAERARKLETEAEQLHAMFNNNARDLAPKAARALRDVLGQQPAPAPPG